jgi:hypothetical protein
MNISVNQGINFWTQLTKAYYGENSYGGHTCEIYLYSMMEHIPSFANNPDSKFCADEVREAKAAMFKLIGKFEETFQCRVLEDEKAPTLEGTWRYWLTVRELEME